MRRRGIFGGSSATSTDYRRPHRPGALRLANRVLRRLSSRRLRASLAESSLIEAAEQRTGLLK